MSLISTALKISEALTPLSTLTYLSSKITDVPLGKVTQFLIKEFITEELRNNKIYELPINVNGNFKMGVLYNINNKFKIEEYLNWKIK